MKKISLLIILFLTQLLVAQEIPIGGWQEHLSYKNGISVAEGNSMVYCATTSGIFNFKKSDNSMTRLSKVSGLSDVEAEVLNFNSYNNKLLIAYKNSNVDIIENNAIINISDIKRKSIIGNKAINNITFLNQYAYLSCGFGIVVLDMDRDEVKDTYYIGPGGGAINVRDITSDGISLYAATDAGVYIASLSNPNLANFTSWTKMSGLPTGIYNTIGSFYGKIFTNYSKRLMTGAYGQDSLFVFDGVSWTHFIPTGFSPSGSGYIGYSVKNNNNQLVLVLEGSVLTFNSSIVNTGYYSGYFSDVTRAKAAVLDNGGSLWIADTKYGLVSYRPAAGGYGYQYPNGPASENVINMSLSDDQLWVAPGGYTKYFIDGIYSYKENDWSNTKGNYPGVVNLDTVFDFINVLVDPDNVKRVYAASWGLGLVELYNSVPVKKYNESNSSLRQSAVGSTKSLYIYGMAFDESKNLWVTNTGVTKSISCKTPGGAWTGLDFSWIIGVLSLEQMLIDKSDQKWVVISNGGGGILVYKGGPSDSPNPANTKKLSTAAGNGGLPSNTVFCLAKDNDDEIWVGTDKGIAVFYSPENVFTGQNFDAQQILLEQDGHVQILLETENVQCIAVDDANRKWIGTSSSGVFLMSADGTKEIAHFDENNSPLFSNNVKSITINHKTGEVYFGTAKGIISYRGTAAEAYDEFTDVYAFPNPVKHEYDGPIAIKGLMNNTTLKITDISGSLVYETKSEGGQAIWNGKNFKDERVSSGVYLVFCTSEDGSRKMVTKILVIN